ncbi:diguanylate cyclase domain-containing protein [Sporosarcina sp. ITBMC105]
MNVQEYMTKRISDSLSLLEDSFSIARLSRTGEIIEVNEHFLQLTHYTKDDLLRKPYDKLLVSLEDFQAVLETVVAVDRWYGRMELISEIGEHRWLESTFIPIMEDNGEVKEIVSIHIDRTAERNVKKWRQMAFRHELTNLPNRRAMLEKLDHFVVIGENGQSPFAVMYLDINHFKTINDVYGHHIGDRLIIEFGKRLAEMASQNVHIFHLSGDEFILLLEGHSHLNAIIQSIFNRFDESFILDGNRLNISVSIGISLYPDDSLHPSSLLQLADQAMYEAKASAQHKYRFSNKHL